MSKRLCKEIFRLHPSLRVRGFLPMKDPLTEFPSGSPYEMLDAVGKELPDALRDKDFRRYAAHLDIPHFRIPSHIDEETLRELQLYYVRSHFLQSGYVNQVGQPPVNSIPKNIARATARAAYHLNRPPILSYDGYALYNWRRIDPALPVALGNIDTFQNFVDMYDEHWFILVHIEIEAIAAEILAALALYTEEGIDIDTTLSRMHGALSRMVAVLRRIPERMDSDLYYSTFRPYIKDFDKVVYQGVNSERRSYRGETGAQSSIMPLLQSFLKISHTPTGLTEHLRDMRSYMPLEHVVLLDAVDTLPSVQDSASKDIWNAVLEVIAEFRGVHFGYAQQYIQRHGGKVGTGRTPYAEWLPQLRTETLAEKK